VPELFTSSSPFSLETTGFKVLKHASRLHSAPYTQDSFLSQSTLKDIYQHEVADLMKKELNCSKVWVTQSALRLKKAYAPLMTASERAVAPTKLLEDERCGTKLDGTEDHTKPLILGGESAVGPARSMHIDYSASGASALLRNSRPEILDDEIVKDIIAVDDKEGQGMGRRYAIFSIWRPIKEVARDPLAMCDPRTIDFKRDLIEHVNKASIPYSQKIA
jgi:GA4 desaturase